MQLPIFYFFIYCNKSGEPPPISEELKRRDEHSSLYFYKPDALEKLIGIHQNPSSLCPVGRKILEAYHEKERRQQSGKESVILDFGDNDMKQADP